MTASPEQQVSNAAVLPTGAKLDRYEILAKLAAGGMATVYVARAQDAAGAESHVAVKVLHPGFAHETEFVNMLFDEARLAARIRHPNVVSTLGVSGSANDLAGFFIVMEYIEGDTLAGLLTNAHTRLGKLPVPVTLRIVLDALAALGSAHALCDDAGKLLNLVHRDVSPHNILIGCDGLARLTDFGIAKAEDRLTQTREGQIKGKLAYMAPEQAVGMKTDARSDLFAMGVILWECLTGRRLFKGETATITLHKLLRAEIARPSSFDAALAPLDGLLERALGRTPEARFASAEEFARAIAEVAPAVGGVAAPRAVARALRQCSGHKLAQERSLLDAARRELQRIAAGIPREPDGASGTLARPIPVPPAPALTIPPPPLSRAPRRPPVSGIFVNPESIPAMSLRPPRRRSQSGAYTRSGHGELRPRPRRWTRIALIALLAAGAFYLSFQQARGAAANVPATSAAAESAR